MSDILIDNQGAPSTPAASKSIVWVDSTSKCLVQTNDAGRHLGDLSRNDASASQGAGFAADTYVTNSGILIPSFGMKAGQCYKWLISLSKTAAGTAQAVFTFRIGPNQSTGDTSRLALTATTAQAAAISAGILMAFVQVRNVGASGVIAGGVGLMCNNTGLGSGIDGASSTFDNSALAGQYLGLSINGGASAAWTVSGVVAELIG